MRRSARRQTRGRRVGATATAIAVLAGAGIHAEPAAPLGAPCPAFRAGPDDAAGSAPRLHEGRVLGYADLAGVRALLPPEVWRYRRAFFHPGMQLEIGPCQRRYPARESAAEPFSHAQLDSEGNLTGRWSGLPFPPGTSSVEAEDAAARWAWNFVHRDRGAGPHGRFRIVDKPGRTGARQTYSGSWYWMTGGHRDTSERPPLWIAGGLFEAPGAVRRLAWRQTRTAESQGDGALPDETLVYLPSLRKVRRAATSWVDGLFVPRYRAGGSVSGERTIPLGGGAAVSSGGSLAASEHLRRGWLGLTLRPNAYRWRLGAAQDVLAPLNVARSGFPIQPDRRFGPSGLSAASDRWDVRRALVLHGALRESRPAYDLLTLYLDAETLHPLYYVSKRRGGRVVDVGILLHRFSGDQPGYPGWPDGSAASVFDPVAAVFYESLGGGSGWRRESYDVRSTPPSEADRARWLGPLERRR